VRREDGELKERQATRHPDVYVDVEGQRGSIGGGDVVEEGGCKDLG
jgi:hypothetical protein